MEYFQFSNPFFVAHLVTGAIALGFFVFLVMSTRAVSKQVGIARAISESEVRKLLYPIERFDAIFEFCSSCFVLIGLIGTITGFFHALPHLSDPKYDLHDLKPALTTSGFGITWAIALNLVLVLYNRIVVAPITQKVLDKVTVEQLAQSLAGSLEKFSGQITEELRRGLVTFSFAATRVANASKSLAQASQAAGTTYSDAMKNAEAAAEKVGQVLERATQLPQTIVENIAGAFEKQTSLQQEVLTQNRNALSTIAEDNRRIMADEMAALSGKFQETSSNLVKVQATHIEQSVSALQDMLLEQQRALDALAEREKIAAAQDEAIRARYHESIEFLMKEQAAAMEQSLSQFQKALAQLQSSISADLLEQGKTIHADFAATKAEAIRLLGEIEKAFTSSFEMKLAKLTTSNAEAIKEMTAVPSRLSSAISTQTSNMASVTEPHASPDLRRRATAVGAEPLTTAQPHHPNSGRHSMNPQPFPKASPPPKSLWKRLLRRS